MAHISMPVLVVGLLTCVVLELTGAFGYGAKLGPRVREVLEAFDDDMSAKRTMQQKAVILSPRVSSQSCSSSRWRPTLAEPGIIGLMVIVLSTALNGVTEEHRLGHAFEEALPFTALLVVFFGIVSVIADQKLFTPIFEWVMHYEGKTQEALFFVANGLLSMISDNVFVATSTSTRSTSTSRPARSPATSSTSWPSRSIPARTFRRSQRRTARRRSCSC